MKGSVTVIVIAQNEQANIQFCVRSVKGWASEIYVVDSFSTDDTGKIAEEEGAIVAFHEFYDWASQRNWALDNLPLKTDWILFIDADEQATDMFKQEVDSSLAAAPLDVAAFSIHLDTIFLGRSLRHAFESPAYIRLVRRGKARWHGVGAREYCEADGHVLDISHRVWHEDHKGLSIWIEKQNRNATREACVLVDHSTQENQDQYTRKTSERKWRAWIRERIWNKMPLFIRPLFYFVYRYILRGGFLDGYAGLAYTFLQGFWLTFLIDAKYYEIIQQSKRK
jgi:glycosyltransferase involved in cell wall biosynthesis